MSRPHDPSPSLRADGRRPAVAAAAAHGHAAHPARDLERTYRQLQNERNRTVIRNGLASILGLLCFAAVVAWAWQRADADRQAARAVEATRRTALRADLLPAGTLTADAAQRLLERIEAERAAWEHGPDADAIRQRAEHAHGIVVAARNAEIVTGELTAVASAVDAAGTMGNAVDAWSGLQERLAKLPATATAEPALREAIDAQLERVAVGRFTAELAAAAGPGLAADARLRHLTSAYDLGLERSHCLRRDRARLGAWQDRVRHLVPELDAASRAAYGSPADAATATWQDEPWNPADWQPSRGSPLTHRFADGALQVSLAGGAKAHPAVLARRHARWHACQLAFDLRLARGEVVVLGRAEQDFAPKAAGGVRFVHTALAGGETGVFVVPDARDVHVELTVVADRVTAAVDGTAPVELTITAPERRGALAFVVSPETDFVVRNLRVRRLPRRQRAGFCGAGR
jgi:hypothetical protein